MPNDTEYLQGHSQSDFDTIQGLDASDNLIGSTEDGSVIKFDDQPFLCSKYDDYLPEDTDHWTRCKAHSLGGEDEVLVIESGNPTRISPGVYGPQALAAGDTVTSVDPDPDSRSGAGWSPTALSNWKNAENRSSWGTGLSPYQKKACKYKDHIVRRELVHGSYEEHIEGDMYTTIEGTWISKIKGNIWDTFYGYCHEDFNEHFEEIFYSTKTEVQKGNITEYNYGKSFEYYYADVTNEYGSAGGHITVKETYYGDKWQFCYGDESSVNLANKNDFFLGPMKTDTNVGGVTEAYLAVKMMLAAAVVIEFSASLTVGVQSTHIKKGGVIVETVDAVKMSRVGAVRMKRAGIKIDSSNMYLIS